MKKLILMAILLRIAFGCTSAISCTALFASEGDIILVGNNEDFTSIPTKVWIFPREKGKLGRIYFGFKDIPNIPMGGMNEGGLFFDCFSTDCIRRILSATHLEWQPYRNEVLNTVYSNIYDLKNGIIYLYHFHDYANEAIINLKEELIMCQHSYDIPSLFPKTIAGDRFLDECKKQKATAREIIQALEKGL